MIEQHNKPSESNTENLFRKFYGTDTFIEKHSIPISYGFKSKKKTGKSGYPDFFKDEPNYAIVVEAKKINHIDAENEVKYYMNNNLINKDIIGIAVSGQNNLNLKISYFYRDVSSQKIVELNTNKNSFLSLTDIDEVYKKQKCNIKTNIENLSNYLKGLNEIINTIVRSTDRSLFFAGIMIALKDDNFLAQYKDIQIYSEKNENTIESGYLNQQIINAIDRQLKDKENNYSKKHNWKDQFAFINNVDYPLDKYKKMITEIYENAFLPFFAGQKLDILGKAYKIFLSRAGQAEDKNIIFTPDHIKSLMVRLADLDKEDVVLDTCMGTSGFLMEAMEVMENQVKDCPNDISKIHNKQLIGIENDAVLFALACSNMFLHGDGRSNLIYRSSLSDDDNIVNSPFAEFRNYIKSLKPKKVIINPPYENNKSIKFVLQALDFLEDGGRLIIIMPTPTLLKNYKKAKEILNKAKLDFVIKMPFNLFNEQKRTVNTSIFGFTKVCSGHKILDEVMFYNLEDDGFKSIQHKGRVDINSSWFSKEEEIYNAINNKNIIPNVCDKRKIYDGDKERLKCYGIKNKINNKYELVPLDKIFYFEKGSLASEKSNDFGEFDFVTASKEWKKHDDYTHDEEALIYVTLSAGSLGRVHYVNGKFIASNLCYILTKKINSKYYINMEFYAYYLNNIKKEIVSELADGTSKLTIPISLLKKYEIEYIPKDIQDDFVNIHLKKIKEIKEFLKHKEKSLSKKFYEKFTY